MRYLLATTAVLALLTSSPVRADIGPGDLGDAASHIADSIVEAISNLTDAVCQYLLEGAEGLTGIVPTPFPDPQAADYPSDIPNSPDSGIEATEESIADQQDRVTKAGEIVALASQAQAAQEAQLKALQGLNLTPPVSIAAGQQIGNQLATVGVQAQTAQAQLLATQVGLQASEIMAREQARTAEIAAIKAFANDYDGGPVQAKAEYIRLFPRQR